jgi:hypothetical protein
MRLHRPLLAPLIGTLVLFGGMLVAQEKKDPPKIRGQLPRGYGKLGLSDEQRQKIYKIQADYDDKIDALEIQLQTLKAQRQKAIDTVLTAEQRKTLRKMIEDMLPKDEVKPPADKK